MNSDSYIPAINLYDLYFTNQISNIEQIKLNSENVNQSDVILSGVIPNLTPLSRMIYKSVSTPDRPKLIQDLLKDDMMIESLEQKDYLNDPDYLEKLENGALGFYMEKYISYYGKCPVCEEFSLRKYVMSNVPVVDFICINRKYHESKNECFLFQLKTSTNDFYFNRSKEYISIGSKRFGYNSHIVKASDNISKKFLVVGYICINLEEVSVSYMQKMVSHYKINNNKSFVIIPDLSENKDEYYYKYIGNILDKNIIRWDNKLVNVKEISSVLNTIKEIDTGLLFNETNQINPYYDFPITMLKDEWTSFLNNKRPKKRRYVLRY